MPGLHLACSTNGTNSLRADEKSAFERTLSRMRHFQWFTSDVVFNDPNVVIGKSCYDGYPIRFSSSEKNVTIIEGAIYNKSEKNVEDELLKILSAKFSPDVLADNVKKFVLTTDGEFIIVKYNKETGDLFVFNDALGRLPFYYCSSPDQLSARIIMSREVKFIVPFLEKPNLDPTSVAEYLLFGYPLSDRTIVKDIHRMPPATMFIINSKNQILLSKQVLSWNLDPTSESSKSANCVHKEAENLVSLFIRSSHGVGHRFSRGYIHIVALSGGLDSRATLAGLCKIGVHPIARSYPSGENQIARKIAEIYGVDHDVISSFFRMPIEDYVKLTDGLLHIGLIAQFSFLAGIREEIASKAILHTGDGGDRTLGPLGFKFNISNVHELLSYIIETAHIFTVDDISSILNLDKEAFVDHLEKYLESFPEKTMEGKYAHFRLFERYFKWVFLGEDRTRLFMWSATPFFSVSFFRASMGLPQRFKQHYMLYKDFLSLLDPVLLRIRYYDRFIPLSLPNWVLKSYLTAFELLKERFYRRGTFNPLNFLLGEPAQGILDQTRDLIINPSNQKNQLGIFNLPNTIKLVAKEKNQTVLNVLATLIIYGRILKSSQSVL